jgi:hypothetical protein
LVTSLVEVGSGVIGVSVVAACFNAAISFSSAADRLLSTDIRADSAVITRLESIHPLSGSVAVVSVDVGSEASPSSACIRLNSTFALPINASFCFAPLIADN